MIISNVDVGPGIKELENNLDNSLITDATFIGRASGNSMEGVGIFSGDLLIIDRAATVKHGDVIVAALNGLFVCKIADLKNNQLLSANPDHPAVKITEHDEYNVEGVVGQSIRLHRTSNLLG
ncbi:S24 family peptidase [Pseudoalteromonas sp. HL-AS1]|uniref:LexA family protein n=1 Tax=Pseudoalteromonas sp. HL-AS1 TaxID=3071081 RepID=UPI002815EAA2|nr:S24 family peptidase [Pseudoalteromonas sp. HL-AS1]WMS91355.1 S24 family peptidase [Pseudoalteromonas sp. HL-AS1]WMT83654.1 SOS sensing protease [Pseudoalteromonas phage ACA1]WMT83706.1 SOS sensing protease [Pseudoalteromonas phage ACA2]WMT83758.1 SOS sensing protease [Pseudoalteromonas phage proACA1-A]